MLQYNESDDMTGSSRDEFLKSPCACVSAFDDVIREGS